MPHPLRGMRSAERNSFFDINFVESSPLANRCSPWHGSRRSTTLAGVLLRAIFSFASVHSNFTCCPVSRENVLSVWFSAPPVRKLQVAKRSFQNRPERSSLLAEFKLRFTRRFEIVRRERRTNRPHGISDRESSI